MFRWVHRLIRRKTRRIETDTAISMKSKLSFLYMILAWNAFGAVLYFSFTGRKDWPDYYGLKSDDEKAKPAAVYYAELLGVKKADVYSIRGLTKVDEYKYISPEESSK